MLDSLMDYGDRDKGPDTALLTLIFLILALLFITESGSLETSQTQEQVATSGIVPDGVLGTFRVACSLLVVITLSWVTLDPKGSGDFPLYLRERETRPRKVVGPTRLAAFTMWHFALIGLSFGVSGAATWIHASGGTVPEWMIVASPILFSTSYACAILVTCVISFHIIGDNLAKGHRVSHLFTWYEIVMHNANVALLGISLLVNDMEVELSFLAFPAVFGILYVSWAAIYANFISGVFIYDFMDYRKRGAPLIYLALLSLQTIFFFVVMALDRIAELSLILAAVIVFAMTWRISTIKDPSQG
ncbi:MAG: hypothetical protein QGI73_01555 [Candidatus Thalassarchaeaceae archaeon]|jgi:hypothetical protein|nr:hypothetical protein [Candidatus Thalassarchaeaceae archaeon]